MSTHDVKGWCPGVLRPMMSGDGLVVRVRPYHGRLSRAQADGIASMAAAHGNGLLDVSSRGNLQIRGVSQDSHAALIEGLYALGLVDPTPEIEQRRNILTTPFWQRGDETEALTKALTKHLAAQAPDLPAKFGFAVDTGPKPVLQNASADIRIERDAGGGLILVADGMDTGQPIASDTAIDEVMILAQWFATHRGDATRMKAITPPGAALVPRQTDSYLPAPGYTPNGAMVGLAFGQLDVQTLASLAKHGALRLTPWRLILVESARALPQIDGVITDPNNPLLRITACTGAPGCPQALAQTRSLGRALAPHLKPAQTLHISGCTKGCAHPRAAPLTFTAQPDGFALVRDGKAGDPPARAGLSPMDLKDHL